MTYHKKEALQANLDAVRTLLALENTRRAPTERESAVLRRYNGFAASNAFSFRPLIRPTSTAGRETNATCFHSFANCAKPSSAKRPRAMPRAFGTASKAAYSLRFTPTNASSAPSPRGLG